MMRMANGDNNLAMLNMHLNAIKDILSNSLNNGQNISINVNNGERNDFSSILSMALTQDDSKNLSSRKEVVRDDIYSFADIPMEDTSNIKSEIGEKAAVFKKSTAIANSTESDSKTEEIIPGTSPNRFAVIETEEPNSSELTREEMYEKFPFIQNWDTRNRLIQEASETGDWRNFYRYEAEYHPGLAKRYNSVVDNNGDIEYIPNKKYYERAAHRFAVAAETNPEMQANADRFRRLYEAAPAAIG